MLGERGHRVIGVDLHDAEATAGRSTSDGRAELVSRVTELSDGRIDAIIANAGLATPTAKTVAINYFGTVATLTGLRERSGHGITTRKTSGPTASCRRRGGCSGRSARTVSRRMFFLLRKRRRQVGWKWI